MRQQQRGCVQQQCDEVEETELFLNEESIKQIADRVIEQIGKELIQAMQGCVCYDNPNR